MVLVEAGCARVGSVWDRGASIWGILVLWDRGGSRWGS